MTDDKKPEAASTPPTPSTPPPPPPPDRESATDHSARIGGRKIAYRATAGTYTLRDDAGQPKATIFYTTYTMAGVEDPGSRPLTFAFNGGPGSSSAWLHLGILGPRRIEFGEADTPPPPPYRLVDNSDSILDETDLVFIDPISTGYSRALEGEEAKQFHGLNEDVRWVGEFIRLHTSRAQRWESRKFLIGESYGTTRAAALSLHLQDKLGMSINGVALISSILMFATARPGVGNDLPYILYLPSYAATAWYHGRLGKGYRKLRALADEVEEFALGEYASLLLKGPRATDQERRQVVARLSRYTGLSEAYVERCDLRIAPGRFFKELLRDQRRTVGRLDSRFLGIDTDAAGELVDYDPSLSYIQGPFTALVNHYLRSELGFKDDAAYEVLNGERVSPWNFGDKGDNKYAEVASDLRMAMSRNRDLRVLLASGYYDLATAFCAAEWQLDHMGLDPALRRNITTRRYEAGHMMYVHEPSARALKKDLVQLIRG